MNLNVLKVLIDILATHSPDLANQANRIKGFVMDLWPTAYYAPDRIVEGLGSARAVEAVYFKPYTCCRWIHSALDALGGILETYPVDANDVQEIQVHTFERALRLTNETDPATIEGAQYSLNYCLAVRLIEGPQALLPLASRLLGRADLVALARKISLHVDSDLDRQFPEKTAARVVLVTSGTRHTQSCLHPLGDPANPMDFSHLTAKFNTLTSHYTSPAWRQALNDAIGRLPDSGVRPFFTLLTKET